MAGGASFPRWSDKTDAIQKWAAWATKADGDWFYKKTERGRRQPNKPYFTLTMRRLIEVGVPEVLNVDLENLPEKPCVPLPTGTPDAPRAEVVISQRRLQIDLRIYSYDQDTNQTAWVVADSARARMRLPTPRERFLDPVQVSLAELFQVIHMPNRARALEGDRDKPTPTDDRFYSEALIEMHLSTAVAESDNSAVGTWIERTLVSSDITPLPAKLQLDNELMGLPFPATP